MMPTENAEPDQMSPADAAEMLLAMARDEDDSMGGAALSWRLAKPLIEKVAGAVVETMADAVC